MYKFFTKTEGRGVFSLAFLWAVYHIPEFLIGTYLTLIYRNDFKFSMTLIGILTAVGPMTAFISQPFWGSLADRSKTKNRVLTILLIGMGVFYLVFHLVYQIPNNTTAFIMCLVVSCCVFFFYQSVQSIMGAISLEYVAPTRFDYAIMRSSAVFGFSMTGFVMSFLLSKFNIPLKSTITMLFAACIFCAVWSLWIPKIKGHQYFDKNKLEENKNIEKPKKVSFIKVIKNPILMPVYIYGIFYAVANGLSLNFFAIYFTETLGASSSMLTLHNTLSAFFEIPLTLLAVKFVKNISHRKITITATCLVLIRLLALLFVKNPNIIMLLVPFSSIVAVISMYCNIMFINNNAPSKLKASAQSMWAMISIAVSRVSTLIGGFISDLWGMKTCFAISIIILVLITLIMFKYLPNRPNIPNPDAEKYA